MRKVAIFRDVREAAEEALSDLDLTGKERLDLISRIVVALEADRRVFRAVLGMDSTEPIENDIAISLNKSGKQVLIVPFGYERMRVVVEGEMMRFIDWLIVAVDKFKNDPDSSFLIVPQVVTGGAIKVVEVME